MTIASGIFKQVRYVPESTWGTKPSAGTAGFGVRRVSSDIDLHKNTYESQEIRSDQQVYDFRHGTNMITGTINGELAGQSYYPLLEAFLRRDFAAGGDTTAAQTIDANAAGYFDWTDAAGTDWTTQFKVGNIVAISGSATANNNMYWIVTGFADAAATNDRMNVIAIDGATAVTADTGGGDERVVLANSSFNTYIPATGHTNKSFTFEHVYTKSGIDLAEQFVGCKINGFNVSMPATGLATVGIDVMGKAMERTSGASAPYFTAISETINNTPLLAAVNGIVLLDGSAQAVVTGLNINMVGGLTSGEVVGSLYTPDIFPGRVRISGQATVYFEDVTYQDAFVNESEHSLHMILTSPNASVPGQPAFLSFFLPRVKFGGAAKDDGEKGLIQTMPFQALKYVNAAGSDYTETTIVVQDSGVTA